MPRLPALDGLRGLATLSVFFLHLSTLLRRTLHFTPDPAQTPLGWLLDRGGLGVPIFFALSGYVVALPFLSREPIDPKAFWRRRFRRILVPYLLIVAVLFLGQVALHRLDFRGGLLHLLASLGFVHNLVYGTWSPIEPVAWSLEIEVQFYLLAPFLIPVVLGRPKIAIGISLLWAVLIALTRPTLDRLHLALSFLSHGPFFLLGIALAALAPLWKPRVHNDFLGILGVLVLIGCYTTLGVASELGIVLGVLLFFGGVLGGVWLPRLCSLKGLRWIGVRCFSIYLLHVPLLAALLPGIARLKLPLSFPIALLLASLLSLPLIALFAHIFYQKIESRVTKRNQLEKS